MLITFSVSARLADDDLFNQHHIILGLEEVNRLIADELYTCFESSRIPSNIE